MKHRQKQNSSVVLELKLLVDIGSSIWVTLVLIDGVYFQGTTLEFQYEL